MNRDQALQDLAAVASVVADETSKPSLRIRLILPWLDQADRFNAMWRDRRQYLLAIYPASEGVATEIELTRIRSAVAEVRKRPSKTNVDFPAEHQRIAEIAGVTLPGTGVAVSVTPTSNTVIAALSRAIDALADCSGRTAPARGIRDRAQAVVGAHSGGHGPTGAAKPVDPFAALSPADVSTPSRSAGMSLADLQVKRPPSKEDLHAQAEAMRQADAQKPPEPKPLSTDWGR